MKASSEDYNNEIRIALIGAGARGKVLYRAALKHIDGINLVALCDIDTENQEKLIKEIENDGKFSPKIYNDFKTCIDEIKPDVAIIATKWETHIDFSIYAMEHGTAVACEVGGSYDLNKLWELVRCYQRTKTPIMLMENCCYGQTELLALEMKRRGLLGTIVNCEGGYRHDLRAEMAKNPKHYRIYEYMNHNCENYPTHEIGPIAKLLDINCGNRFTSLVSVASSSHGLKEYVKEENIEWLNNVEFMQGDIITTVLKCANGETVTMTLDTTLPRYYSRGFSVHGTKGMICEENRSVFLENDFPGEHFDWKNNFNNIDSYYEKYNHRLWKNYHPGLEGHGGMDFLTFSAFFEALKNKEPMPINVYDMATWMAITALSMESILNNKEVDFPDFTEGKWLTTKNDFEL